METQTVLNQCHFERSQKSCGNYDLNYFRISLQYRNDKK